ncbi:MAG: sulfatase-like hydrolase/transferase [Chloroflexota bacterium]
MKDSLNRREFLKLAAALPLLKLGASARLVPPEATLSSPPANILILIFDALSARNMSLYGYPRQTTPNMDRFAGRATVYHAHYAAGNYTTPGTASLFTGVYPWSHRALHLHGTMLDDYTLRNFFYLAAPHYYRLGYSHNLLVTTLLYQLRPDLEEFKFGRDLSLADTEYSDRVFPNDYNASFWGEELALRGSSTLPSSLFISQLYRLWQDWRERRVQAQYSKQFPQGLPSNNGVLYNMEKGIDWCTQQLGQLPQPFLAYIHFLPPHHPYNPRKEFVNRFQDDYNPLKKPRHRFAETGATNQFLKQQRQAYDENLAYADSEFGRLYEQLLSQGLLENTCLAITSDHGEMFERGIWGHGTRTLYEPLIRVPMILSQPGQAQRQDVYTPTSNVDLLPSLLHLMGQPVPAWCEGRILPGLDGPASTDSSLSERSIYAMEAKQNAQRGPLKSGTFALIQGRYKLIRYRGYGSASGTGGAKENPDELYDLANDPEELENRNLAEKSLAEELAHELEVKLAEKGTRLA